ncbi:hypothetical protein Taro_016783, partial [Colocasia esculenta]|nr:hypothetical protein [Colocasia esculenta]
RWFVENKIEQGVARGVQSWGGHLGRVFSSFEVLQGSRMSLPWLVPIRTSDFALEEGWSSCLD